MKILVDLLIHKSYIFEKFNHLTVEKFVKPDVKNGKK